MPEMLAPALGKRHFCSSRGVHALAGRVYFNETLLDESSVGADQLQAWQAAYRSAFAAGFILIGAALIFLHGAVRRVPKNPHDRADQGAA